MTSICIYGISLQLAAAKPSKSLSRLGFDYSLGCVLSFSSFLAHPAAPPSHLCPGPSSLSPFVRPSAGRLLPTAVALFGGDLSLPAAAAPRCTIALCTSRYWQTSSADPDCWRRAARACRGRSQPAPSAERAGTRRPPRPPPSDGEPRAWPESRQESGRTLGPRSCKLLI